MNRTLRQAKSIRGELEVPASYNEVVSIVMPSLFASGETLVAPVPKCGGIEALFGFLNKQFGGVSRESGKLIVKGSGGFASSTLPSELDAGEVPDLVERLIPLFFGRGVRISCRKEALPPRFLKILKKLDSAGFLVTRSDEGERIVFQLTSSAPDAVEVEINPPDEIAKVSALYALLAGATGLSKVIETTPLPNNCEGILKKLGADIYVHRKGDEMDMNAPDETEPVDELEKRIRRLQARKESANERPLKVVTVKEHRQLTGTSFELQGDLLLAAPFFTSALLLNNSSVTIKKIGGSAIAGLLSVLRRMGAPLKTERSRNGDAFDLVSESLRLSGRRVSGELTASLGEAFPFAAVAACYAQGQTLIRDADFLREGPCDLIQGTLKNLKAMGAKVGEIEDGIVIEGAREYDGAEFDTFGSPILGLAFSVAAIKNKGESVIKNAEAVDFLWPDFYFTLESLLEK